MAPESDEAAIRARLEAVRAKRGYLLPHHGLLAVAAPRLLEAYDGAYTALALEDRVLSRRERELVWLVVLIATDEAIATHHIAKLRAAGGGDAEIAAAIALAGLGLGVGAYRFVAEHWREQVKPLDPAALYLGAVATAHGAAVPEALAHLALAALHTAKAAWRPLAWHIEAAYRCHADETALAEALTLAMFPGSVPHFVEACAVWRELIRAGRVAASPPFRLWAEMPGQGGYDEASST
jgi:alkylhydroperoxidase/carboxymuconolactone decarboxylase family protein YurZ